MDKFKITKVKKLNGTIMNNKIIKILKEQKSVLEKNFHINKIGIFGSYARNEETPDSDIDILVEYNKTPGLFEFFSLEEHLETVLNKKIDLVRKEGLKKQIKEQVLSEVLYI